MNNRTPQQKAQDAIERINDNLKTLNDLKHSLELALKKNDEATMIAIYIEYMNNYNF